LLSAEYVADAYISLGRARDALLATGEVPSLVTSLDFASREDLATNFAHVTMGDAGGALVLCAAESASQGILATAWINRGEAWELGTILGAGTMYPHERDREHALLRSRSAELEAHARRDIPLVVARVLEAAEWRADTVDVVACHQHSQRITVELLRVFGIDPQRAPLPLRYAGNAVSANVVLALAQAHDEGRLAPGRRVLLCSGSAGFSAIATAVSW
jgi:3-oxoacyl-[acyl-carrier-protein] synthase-3